ncbi:MAG: GntR family transcriptional regulator [Acidimicrobiales bacterium]|nr:GntR family transcriptional regulator [Acidimicrobiales bacterium]MCB9395278.1 GntR family transcriptional regulator [Acidimicrobiaceae bacterium]
MRTIRYQQIADELRDRLAAVGAGEVLPSEADLSTEFAVSRVTVRRALEILRDEGLVDSRQGFGWYVAGEPLRQHLDELSTIEDQLAQRGITPQRQVVEFEFRAAPRRVAKVLGCEQVLRVKRLNLADGQPFAVVTVWCPAELGQHLSRHDVEQHPFYELLGVAIRGATQTIGADSAQGTEAGLLGIPPASPVLRCERITTDVHGRPVLMSEHVFPARRTEFVVELPTAEPSVLPVGLRLVE